MPYSCTSVLWSPLVVNLFNLLCSVCPGFKAGPPAVAHLVTLRDHVCPESHTWTLTPGQALCGCLQLQRGQKLQACICRQGDDAAPTRVIVFAPSPEAAQAAAQPIRNVLWGQHNVTVLLPQGEEPIKASTSFLVQYVPQCSNVLSTFLSYLTVCLLLLDQVPSDTTQSVS